MIIEQILVRETTWTFKEENRIKDKNRAITHSENWFIIISPRSKLMINIFLVSKAWKNIHTIRISMKDATIFTDMSPDMGSSDYRTSTNQWNKFMENFKDKKISRQALQMRLRMVSSLE